MSKKLSISLDNTEFSRSIVTMNRDLQKLSKSGIKLLDKEAMRDLDKLSKQSLKDIKKELQSVNSEWKNQLKHIQTLKKGTEEFAEAMKKLNALHRDHATLSKSLADGRMGGFGAGFGAGRGGIRGMIGGMTRGGLTGMGMLGLGLGGLAAGGLAAGLYGFSRLSAGYQTYMGGLDDRLGLMGRGYAGTPSGSAMSNAGLSSLSFRQAQLASSDIFGASGASASAVLNRSSFERARGIQSGTLLNIGQGLSGTLGGSGAQKAVMQIQAAMIASNIKDEIGPYLETAAGMLSRINENGFSFDDSALAALNSLYADTKNLNFSAGLISNVDQQIKGAKGPLAALMMQSYSRAGIGGDSALGLQMSMRMGGLFGADISKYGLKKGGIYESVLGKLSGGPDHFQKVSKGLLQSLDMFGGGEAGAKQKMAFVEQMGLAKNAGEAAKVIELLESSQGKGANVNEIRKKLSNLNKGLDEQSLENLKNINSSTAGAADSLSKLDTTMKDALGESVAPAMNKINSTLLTIDEGILSLVNGFAKMLPSFFETPETSFKNALMGKGELTEAHKRKFAAMSPNEQAEVLKSVGKQQIRATSVYEHQNSGLAKFMPMANTYSKEDIKLLNSNLNELVNTSKQALELEKKKKPIPKVGTKD